MGFDKQQLCLNWCATGLFAPTSSIPEHMEQERMKATVSGRP